jgi:hypothetical protein
MEGGSKGTTPVAGCYEKKSGTNRQNGIINAPVVKYVNHNEGAILMIALFGQTRGLPLH